MLSFISLSLSLSHSLSMCIKLKAVENCKIHNEDAVSEKLHIGNYHSNIESSGNEKRRGKKDEGRERKKKSTDWNKLFTKDGKIYIEWREKRRKNGDGKMWFSRDSLILCVACLANEKCFYVYFVFFFIIIFFLLFFFFGGNVFLVSALPCNMIMIFKKRTLNGNLRDYFFSCVCCFLSLFLCFFFEGFEWDLKFFSLLLI